MNEPREDDEAPMDAEASMPGAEGSWHNVPRPTSEELVTPSAQVVDPPSIPKVVKIVGVFVVLLLLLLSVWLGLSLGRAGSGGPAPTPTPSVDDTLWVLEPPTMVGDFVSGDVTITPGIDGNREIVRANYTDGTDKLILLLSRPENDLDTYLENANVTDVEPIEGADGVSCGTSGDTAVPVCARIVDDTAIGVAGLTEQDFPELTSLVDSFYEELQ